MIPSFEHRHAAGGRACPFFGGDSSSTSTQTTQNTDRRVVQAEGSINASDGSAVNVANIDPGAFTLGNKIVDQVPVLVNANNTGLKAVLDFARQESETFTQRSADVITQAAQYTRDAYADAKGTGKSADLLLALIVAGAIVAVVVFKGKA